MRSIAIIFTILFPVILFAQKQNNTWYFGANAGIDFNVTPPVPLTTKVKILENGACVSDRYTGKILFYTNGEKVYDRTDLPMPNGDSIGNDEFLTSAQGSLIVPMPGNASKYYVFTVGPVIYSNGTLKYSVVDMTLNNGLGDVSDKAIIIDSNFTEMLTATTHCNQVYVIAMKRLTDEIYVYTVTDTGIITKPVISKTGYQRTNDGVCLAKISHDGRKLAITCPIELVNSSILKSYIAVHDFDPLTRKVSRGIIIDSVNKYQFYGCEFSTDNNKLYAVAIADRRLYQYDISVHNATAIYNSRKELYYGGAGTMYAPQLAPDGNIYVPFYNSDSIGRITNINASFPDCSFTAKAILLPPPISKCNFNLPQRVIYANENLQVFIGNDTAMCNEDSITLSCYPKSANYSYAWNTGNTNESIVVKKPGTYKLRVYSGMCSNEDSIVIAGLPAPSVSLTKYDKELCSADTLVLQVIKSALTPYSLTWQDGTGDSVYIVRRAGVFSIQLSDVCGTVQDSVTIKYRNCHIWFPNAFTPNNDGLNDQAKLVGDIQHVSQFSMSVFNRWGEQVFISNDPSQGWDGLYKNKDAPVGTYWYLITYNFLGTTETLKGDIALIR